MANENEILLKLKALDELTPVMVKAMASMTATSDRMTKALGDDNKDIQEANEKTGTSFGAVFKGTLAANAVTKAFELASRAAKQLFDVFVTQGIQAAQVQEDAINQLNTALALAGDFSIEASQDLQAYASQLQSMTVIGDEAILKQLSLAKAFGASNEQSKKLVEAAIDLSAATGISLDSAVKNQ